MPPAVPSKGSSGSLLHAFSSSIVAIRSLFSSLIQAIHVDVEQFFMLCGSGKRCGNPNGRITLLLLCISSLLKAVSIRCFTLSALP